MRRVGRFLALPAQQKRQFLEALFELARVRLRISLSPRRPLQQLVPPEPRAGKQGAIEDLAWAAEAASRYVPGATCLIQALALQELCARRGLETSLQIGVAHGERRELEAHAWLERNGRILIGSSGSSGFSPLSGLPGG